MATWIKDISVKFQGPSLEQTLPPPSPSTLQSGWSGALFDPMSFMPQIFSEDSGNLKQPKNVKTNTCASHRQLKANSPTEAAIEMCSGK